MPKTQSKFTEGKLYTIKGDGDYRTPVTYAYQYKHEGKQFRVFIVKGSFKPEGKKRSIIGEAKKQAYLKKPVSSGMGADTGKGSGGSSSKQTKKQAQREADERAYAKKLVSSGVSWVEAVAISKGLRPAPANEKPGWRPQHLTRLPKIKAESVTPAQAIRLPKVPKPI